MRELPVVQVDHLRVSFGTGAERVGAVDGLTFAVRPGETLCLVGESGSGKSASALALMRLIEFGGGQIDAGRVLFDAQRSEPVAIEAADQARMRQLRGHRIGMMFQDPMSALNPAFTIGWQVTEGLRFHMKMGQARARARALELLRDVRLPDPERRFSQYPHELSGGMRQRVCLAMALACQPRLLIADEPTTALDVTTQAEILILIDQLKRRHDMAVILITHDMAVVAQMADHVVVMRAGQQVETGPVAQIFKAPQHDYTRILLASVPRLGDMAAEPRPRPMPVPGQPPGKPIRGQEEELLCVEGLTTRFAVKGGLLRRPVAAVHAVEDVSFSIKRGQTLALVGESGCGKSTTGRSVLRLEEPQSGRIWLDGIEITGLPPAALRRARMHMQMVFQDPLNSLNPQKRLFDLVAEPLWNFDSVPRSEVAPCVARLFDQVGLPGTYQQRYPHELSGGQRQRVAIARALALNPKLIVADEAVSALDVSVQARVLNLMMALQAELGLSYLFISHDMAVVERIAHEVAVMYRGRIVERGPRAAVFGTPQHPYTKALLSAVPVADPDRRRLSQDPAPAPVPSPIHPLGYRAAPSVYARVGEGHEVLTSPDWG